MAPDHASKLLPLLLPPLGVTSLKLLWKNNYKHEELCKLASKDQHVTWTKYFQIRAKAETRGSPPPGAPSTTFYTQRDLNGQIVTFELAISGFWIH